MKKKVSIILSMILILAMIPMSVFANNVNISVSNLGNMAQGVSSTTLKVEVKSDSAISDSQVRVDKGNLPGSILLKNSSNTISGSTHIKTLEYSVDLIGIPLGNPVDVKFSVYENNVKLAEKTSVLLVSPIDEADRGKGNVPPTTPIDNAYKPDSSVNYIPQMKIEAIIPNGELGAGVTNNISLRLKNTGNAPFNTVFATINLGDGMTLSNATTEQNIGSMGTNSEKTINFPVFVQSNHSGGNVPINFSVRALDPTGKETTFTSTQFVSVGAGTSLADQLEIVNISNPSQVGANQDFVLKFSIRNNSSQVAKNVKIMVEPTAPIVNKTKNIFVETISAGEVKDFNVTMFASSASEAQNYPIKISAETQGQNPASIVQYSGVFVNGDSSKSVPQIIISNYNYGNASVIANEVFTLSMTLKNTSKTQTVKNIKVSISSDEGTFIPHNTSSSFYIDSIAANSSITKSIELMTKPDAAEKTVSVSVDMSYEDAKGTPVSAKDIISVPVVQERKIEIDEVQQLGELYVGEAGNLSIKYYNMGKNTLNNLIIDVEPSEDFAFPQSPKMFVGKFDSGKSDTFDFALTPNKEGDLQGKVIFTFEDSNGKKITIEKPFKATAIQMVMPEIEEPVEPEKTGGLLKWIAVPVVLGAIGGVVFYRIRRKKKMNDSLDIDIE